MLNERYMDHLVPPGHPERPERIGVLLDWFEASPREDLFSIEPLEAQRETVLSNHAAHYLERLESTAEKEVVALDPDTYTSRASLRTALSAAGGVVALLDAVMSGQVRNGIALVRPPGHHAEPTRAMGFCLLNNTAIGARHLRENHGLQRIMIVDWDVHHGNGTQKSFYEEKDILYTSIHRYPFYPGTGTVDECGEGEGEGYTINVPLPPGMEDADYLAVMERLVLPVIDAFSPDFIIVSAGFDAHAMDPLGGMRLSERGFSLMTRMLLKNALSRCGGRMVAVLEGGYHLGALRACVDGVVRELGGGSLSEPVTATGSGPEVLERVIEIQRKYWPL